MHKQKSKKLKEIWMIQQKDQKKKKENTLLTSLHSKIIDINILYYWKCYGASQSKREYQGTKEKK